MKQHKDILIANSLLKSKEALDDAKYALEGARLNTAQNRIYYAIFYSVMALGYLNDFITSKHSQLLGWFNKKFIHENNIFDNGIFITYKTAYENRMKSDYEFTYKPDKDIVNKCFEDAQGFINTIENYIKICQN
ncbi:MAG: HEPN domain-containing protein [bacterium]